MSFCLTQCLNSTRFDHVHSRSLTVKARAFVAGMASSTVRVAAAQMTSSNDLAANFATCSLFVKEAAAAGAKLLCLPESFSFIGDKDGDSIKIAEPLDGPIMQQYCSLARESGIWLSLGGFQERGSDDAHLRNTHVIIDDSGSIRSTYRKIFLFDVDVPGGRVYKESSFTEAGKDIVAVDSPVGCLGLSVCYDLRFPELYQQLRFQHDAQILLVPAAFTKITGEAHWEILLRARAIETQCYVIAAAQAGKHNDKRESYGDTLIIDPWGTVVGRLPNRFSSGITVADIDFSLIDSVRAKIPIAQDRHNKLLPAASQSVEGSAETPHIDEPQINFTVVDGIKKQKIYGLGSCASSYIAHFSQSITASERRDGCRSQAELREDIRNELREEFDERLHTVLDRRMEECLEEKFRIAMDTRIKQAVDKIRAEYEPFRSLPRDPNTTNL